MRTLLLAFVSAAALAACTQPAATEAETTAPAAEAVAEAPAAAVVSNAVFVKDGLGAGGYDLVSFFKGAPAAGAAEFSSEVEGVKYQFASAEHKAEFDAEPAKFLPQYGGYCAYGAARGKKFGIDPATGQVINGKLYFNLDQKVQAEFDKDRAGEIAKADAAWEGIKNNPIDG